MKILIIKPSSLGDIVQALPVLTNLRIAFPEAEIHWLVFQAYRELLEDHPDLDQVLSLDRPRISWKSVSQDLLPLRRWLKKNPYDWVIDLQGLFRSGLLTSWTDSQRKIGLASAREGSKFFYTELVDDHASQAAMRYLQVLDHLKVPYNPHLFHLTISHSLPEKIASLKDFVVFHPYSRWETKLWPWRNYSRLARQLSPFPCVFVGNGPWFPIEGENVIDLREQLTLKSLIKTLENAQVVLSTDSGPGHLAAALGVPTLSLFGATDPQKTAPVGKNTDFLTSKTPCSPCMKRSCLSHENMACMKKISVESVFEKISKIFHK